MFRVEPRQRLRAFQVDLPVNRHVSTEPWIDKETRYLPNAVEKEHCCGVDQTLCGADWVHLLHAPICGACRRIE